jgi:hypothetical protein
VSQWWQGWMGGKRAFSRTVLGPASERKQSSVSQLGFVAIVLSWLDTAHCKLSGTKCAAACWLLLLPACLQVLLSDVSGFLPHAMAQQAGNQLVSITPWQVRVCKGVRGEAGV